MAMRTYVCPICDKKVIASELLECTTNDCPACGKEVEIWPAPLPLPEVKEEVEEEDPPRVKRERVNVAVVRLPTVFYVAAWLVILTCLALLGGLPFTVRIRDTVFSSY